MARPDPRGGKIGVKTIKTPKRPVVITKRPPVKKPTRVFTKPTVTKKTVRRPVVKVKTTAKRPSTKTVAGRGTVGEAKRTAQVARIKTTTAKRVSSTGSASRVRKAAEAAKKARVIAQKAQTRATQASQLNKLKSQSKVVREAVESVRVSGNLDQQIVAQKKAIKKATEAKSRQTERQQQQQTIKTATKKKQQVISSTRVGGFGSRGEQASAIDKAISQSRATDLGVFGLPSAFAEESPVKQTTFDQRVQQQRGLPPTAGSLEFVFGGFGSQEAQQSAQQLAKQRAEEKFPDPVAQATDVSQLIGPREQVTETVQIGGPSFIGGVTTDERLDSFGGRELPSSLPSTVPPSGVKSKQQLEFETLRQRSGAPAQASLGSLALDKLQDDRILNFGEDFGSGSLVGDDRQFAPALGLERDVILAQRREQDVFRAINVIQADRVIPLRQTPEGGKGSQAQGIAFLKAKQSGQQPELSVFTRFGEGAGVTAFDFKDEVGRVSGSVGPIGSAGFEDFGLGRESTRGLFATDEGRAVIRSRLDEIPDFSVAESLGFQQAPRRTGELIVETDRPLGETQVVRGKLQGLVSVKRADGSVIQVTPKTAERLGARGALAEISSPVAESPFIGSIESNFGSSDAPVPVDKGGQFKGLNPFGGGGKGGARLSLGSFIPAIPSAFGEEQTVVQVKPSTKSSSINLQGDIQETFTPETRLAGSPTPKSKTKFNPFSPDPSVKDTSRPAQILGEFGERTGVFDTVGEFGRGFGESLQNELIALQNVGSLASGGAIPERQEFKTPSQQVFTGVISGAIGQATGGEGFVSQAGKGLEGARQQIIDEPAFSAGDIAAQAALFIPFGIAKAVGFGAKGVGGIGKALKGAGQSIKSIPSQAGQKVAQAQQKVGSLSTRTQQFGIKTQRAFTDDIDPTLNFGQTARAPSATKKIRPPTPEQSDFARTFDQFPIPRQKGIKTGIGGGKRTVKKIRPDKPEPDDFARAFAKESAFATDIPKGTRTPSRAVSPTARIDPLERVSQSVTDNTKAFRESRNIGSIFGKAPTRDLPVGQADIGFPFAGLGRSSVQDIIGGGGRATTVRLGTGGGGFVKRGGKGTGKGGSGGSGAVISERFGVEIVQTGKFVGKGTKGAKGTKASKSSQAGRGADEGSIVTGRTGQSVLLPPIRGAIRGVGKGTGKGGTKLGDDISRVTDPFGGGAKGKVLSKGKPTLPKPKGKSKGGILGLSGISGIAGAGVIQSVDATPDSAVATDIISREATIQSERPFLGTRVGARSKARTKSRTKARLSSPLTPFGTGAVATDVVPRLKQTPILAPPNRPILRGRGGLPFIFTGQGEDEAGRGKKQRKFFRVFDVAKTPFGRVQRGLGVQVQSDVPIFEVSDVAGRAPKTNVTEKFFAGDQTGKTRSRLRSGKNPVLDDNFFG